MCVLKFLFIYERFFKTDADVYSALSGCDRSGPQLLRHHVRLQTCSHFEDTTRTADASKCGVQGPISKPVLCRRSSFSRQVETSPRTSFNLRLHSFSWLPRGYATTVSMTTITKCVIKPTTAIHLKRGHTRVRVEDENIYCFSNCLGLLLSNSFRKLLEEAPLMTKSSREAHMKEKMDRYPKVSTSYPHTITMLFCLSYVVFF